MLVITTVGTSLLENYRENHPGIDMDYLYLKEEPASNWDNNERRINKIKRALLNWAQAKKETCAEIKSLFSIRHHHSKEIEARLLATDTILSRLVAEVLEQVLKGEMKVFFEPEKDVIKGLQVWDRKRFEKEGLINLIARIEELAFTSKEIAINFTGGYKAIIPYITIMGQLNNIPLYYIFEDTDELIRLPQAPLDINWGIFEKYSHIIEDLAVGIYDWSRYKLKHPVEEDFQACIWEEGECAELNAIGRMFWNKYHNYFVVEVLKGFSYSKDSSGNKREINEALQELYGRLDSLIKENKLRTTEELQIYINSLSEKNDLRHGENPDRDKYIFKSTRKSQIRLVYTPLIKPYGLSLRLFDYVRGDFDHGEYIKEFKRRMKMLTEPDFIVITLRKPLANKF
jgi:putative CRISPR-associated protein (TIGR02619 family)